MTITGVRHVGLSVSNAGRSARWYTTVLGFSELFRETSGDRTAIILRAPDAGVLIGLVHFAASSRDTFTPLPDRARPPVPAGADPGRP